MLKSVICGAIEAIFSDEEFEKALKKEIGNTLDYRLLARAVLNKFDADDIAEAVAEERTLDILDGF